MIAHRKPYGSEEEARRSKAGRNPYAVIEQCLFCDGAWHVTQRKSPSRVPLAVSRSGPSPEVRLLVLERDSYACACCGQTIIGRRYSLGHRLRASQGGQAVPSNLLVFSGWGGEGHHGRIDRRDNPADEERGLTVRSYQDPALVPVTLYTGRRVWLDDDGRYHDEPPREAAA